VTGGGAGGLDADRGLIEDAVKLLLTLAPAGWTQLHGEFEPSSQPSVAHAFVTTAGEQQQQLSVSPAVVSILGEHQRRAADAGAPWRRLVIDCSADGRLSARAEPDASAPTPATSPVRRYRWARTALMAITVGCLTAAAVLFVLGWKRSEPPRADIIAAPVPAPREREAFAVISRWFDAMNGRDAAGMRGLACAEPSPAVTDWIDTTAQQDLESFIVPDAITKFDDVGKQVWVTIAERGRPLDERTKKLVEAAAQRGGFFAERFTLVDDGAGLKVCDVATQS
jgi:hypothetical protein